MASKQVQMHVVPTGAVYPTEYLDAVLTLALAATRMTPADNAAATDNWE